MKQTRLFVGGLSERVKEHKLISKFTPYGSVVKAEIKEKTDAEGNVTVRFAYVNIEASNDQLENCVSALNDTSWKGSQLRVEVAKESFLDRLKREQAERKAKEGPTHQAKVEEKADTDTSRPKQYQVIQNEKKIKYNKSSAPGVLVEESTYFVGDSQQKKKDVREEKMLESFKSYSSFWADTDEEEDQDSEEDEMNDTNASFSKGEGASYLSRSQDSASYLSRSQDKRQNWGFPSKPGSIKTGSDGPSKGMTRYDPTRQEHQQFRLSSSAPVETKTEEDESQKSQETKDEASKSQELMMIDEDDGLGVSQNVESTCSSLLTMFSQAEVQVKDENDEPEPEPVRVEKKRFFFASGDDRILEGLQWMRECNHDEILREFNTVEEELYNLIKTRRSRESRKYNSDGGIDDMDIDETGEQNTEKESFKDVSLLEDDFYDHRWRQAKHKKEKKGIGNKDSVRGQQTGRNFHPGTRGGQGSRGGGGNFRGRGNQRGRGSFRGRSGERNVASTNGARSGVRKFASRNESVRSS